MFVTCGRCNGTGEWRGSYGGRGKCFVCKGSGRVERRLPNAVSSAAARNAVAKRRQATSLTPYAVAAQCINAPLPATQPARVSVALLRREPDAEPFSDPWWDACTVVKPEPAPLSRAEYTASQEWRDYEVSMEWFDGEYEIREAALDAAYTNYRRSASV